MTPEFVETRRDLIFWEYANILSDSNLPDKEQLPLVTEKFKKFQEEINEWTYVLREGVDKNATESSKCFYCNSSDDLILDKIVAERPCGYVESHNLVKACKKCCASKGNKNLMEWWGWDRRYELPREVFAEYLKMLYICHQCKGILDRKVRNINGELNLIDLEAVFVASCEPPKRLEYR